MRIHWGVTTIHTTLLNRSDGRRLTFTVAWDDSRQQYATVVLEGGDSADFKEVLDNHAHKYLGFFDDERSAKAACANYAETWLSGEDAEKCDCAEIAAVPPPSCYMSPDGAHRFDAERIGGGCTACGMASPAAPEVPVV